MKNKVKTINYVKLFGSANIGRDFFCFLELLPVIFSKNNLLPFNLKNLFYRIDAKEYEMYISEGDLCRIKNYIFTNPELVEKMLASYRRDISQYKIFWQKDKLFSSKKYFDKSLKLMEIAGSYMVMTFPQFYEKLEKYCLVEVSKKVGTKNAEKALRILTSSTKKTMLIEKDEHYLSLLKKKKNGKLRDEDILGFVDRFYYSESSNTDNFNILDTNIIKQRMQKDVKSYAKLERKHKNILENIKKTTEKQKSWLKKYKPGKKLKKYLRVLRILGWLRLEIRMNLMQPSETSVKLWYDKFEKELGFGLWITVSELKKILTEQNKKYKNILFKFIQKRKRGYIYYIKNGKPKFIYKRKWNKFFQVHKMAEIIMSKEFSGMVSCRGSNNIVKGQACKIIQGEKDLAKKISKFSSGRILVSNHTTPVFVPAMKVARAVVTDEGGIMSHAAIISRELKIPCIVGTKFLVQNIQSGDKLELDMQKGIVKIIKKK